MTLNERKIKILEAIINDYIAFAEPIGSRTIARKYDFGLSSATIRNEMSDLEEMGYIIQPHASAGRVPTDRGYRLYVDRLMHYRELTQSETEYLRGIIASNINQMEYLMRETAKAISILTNYTTVLSEPKVEKTRLKHLQLMPVDESSIALAVITGSNLIKNQIIPVANAPSPDELMKLTELLNNMLKGRAVEEISSLNFENTGDSLKTDGILSKILEAIQSMFIHMDYAKVYTSGVNNILEFPEFSDIEKAKALFKAFEEKQVLITLLGDNPTDKVQVVIGSENSLLELKDCSIIKANYSYGNKPLGAIGIIGPTRMDYSQVVSILYGIVKNLNALMLYMPGAYEDG